VKRIIRALQLGKREMLKSSEKTLELTTRVLKMDKETAADTYKVVEASFNDTGIPTRESMATIIRAIKAEGDWPTGISHTKRSPSRALLSKWRRSLAIKSRVEENR
jgi:hypothetical protein